jgi:tetratricopeptide (TPR) repeat protein
MKKNLIALLFFLIIIPFAASAQSQNEIRNSTSYKINRGIYNRAVKYNDYDNAITALYGMCVVEPQNDSLLFAMEYLYYNNRNYISAIMVANDVLLLNAGNIAAQEMKAVSLEQVGAKDKALDEYESLYLKNNNNVNYLYKAAFLQYELKRYKESKTNVEILLSNKTIDSLVITLPKGESGQQEIPIKASLHNLKGLIEQAQGNKDEAKKEFDAALAITPDFSFAKQNLDALLKQGK